MRPLLLALLLVGCAPGRSATVPDGTGTGSATGAATGAPTGSATGAATGAPTGSATGTATGTPGGTTTVPFAFWSPDLVDSAGDPLAAQCPKVLPDLFSCDGPNPEIAWEGLPAGTTHLVLIFDDPDAGNFPHWGIYDIPASELGLAQGISGETAVGTPPAGVGELTNGFNYRGYLGSCPGSAHIYRWRLYAVDQTVPAAPTGSSWNQFDTLETWAENNKLASLEMCHIYRP